MLDLIYRILWAVIVIVNVAATYLALGEKKSKFDNVFVFTSVFVWVQGLIYMLRYAIMGEI